MPLTRRHLIPALLALPLIGAALPGAAHDDQILDIAGLYRVEGRNSDGSAYGGRVLLSQDQAKVRVGWTVGSQTYSGEGVLQGRILTVNWGAATPMIYVVVGRELHGTWDGGRALERLIPE
jgi:hypothetical protein